MEELHTEDDRSDFELTHHILPGDPGRDHIAEMAEAFIIEFKRMRWTNESILAMFRIMFIRNVERNMSLIFSTV